MKERPIIMSTDSIRAILAGRKVQTRRVIKPQVEDAEGYELRDALWYPYDYPGGRGERVQCYDALRCPYGVPGDRLWVRETWRIMSLPYDDAPEFQFRADMECSGPNVDLYGIMDDEWYQGWFERQNQKLVEDCQRAGLKEYGPDDQYRWMIETCPTRWQPSIHMPKFAARIWLEVVSVRVERLQEISEVDAQAEGITEDNLFGLAYSPKYQSLTDERYTDLDPGVLLRGPVGNYAMLWDDLNAKRGCSYITNPWVFVISFSRSSEVNHSQK